MKRILRPPLFFFLIPDSLRFNPSARCSGCRVRGKRSVVLSQPKSHIKSKSQFTLALFHSDETLQCLIVAFIFSSKLLLHVFIPTSLPQPVCIRPSLKLGRLPNLAA